MEAGKRQIVDHTGVENQFDLFEGYQKMLDVRCE